MDNVRILEMINDGQLEELKVIIKNEIYKDSLKGNSDAKKRYAAMKRYFKYSNNANKCTSLPCEGVEVKYETYNSFCDGYSIVCTKESLGEMEKFDKADGEYLKIDKFIDFSGDSEKLNINDILAQAKSNGYKYKKSEVDLKGDFNHVFKYRDGYYKIGLLDKAFSIINDGEDAEVFYTNSKAILMIKTSIGMCGVLPFIVRDDLNNKSIVNVTSKYDKNELK